MKAFDMSEFYLQCRICGTSIHLVPDLTITELIERQHGECERVEDASVHKGCANCCICKRPIRNTHDLVDVTWNPNGPKRMAHRACGEQPLAAWIAEATEKMTEEQKRDWERALEE